MNTKRRRTRVGGVSSFYKQISIVNCPRTSTLTMSRTLSVM